MTGPRPWLMCIVVLALGGAVYMTGLGRAPLYFGGDEAYFAINARSIASTGRDLNGVLLPLFVNVTDPLPPAGHSDIWYQPSLFYLLSLVLRFLPFAESTARMPLAAIGLVDAWLVFAIARRLFVSPWYAALAALTLLMAPAHFIFSRQVTDYICPLPFVLAWLLCLVTFIDTGKGWLLFAGGCLLGLGCYSYVASWVMMPFYLSVTWMVAMTSGTARARAAALSTAGFALPLLVLPLWLWSHPTVAADTFARYKLTGTHPASVASGAIERLATYWAYFDPSYLFLSGSPNSTQSTRTAGVLLLPTSVFLVRGVYDVLRRRGPKTNTILLLGFLSAPLAVVAIMPASADYAAGRELAVVPFAILLSMVGVVSLLEHSRQAVRLVAIVLLLAMPVQFASFLADYHGDYQTTSAGWFDPGNFRGVAAYVMSSDAAAIPAVYLSENLDDYGARWRFYTWARQRDDLWQRTRRLAAAERDVSRIAVGSLLVLRPDDPRVPGLVAQNCSVAQVVRGAAGGDSAVILRKDLSAR
jgi:hypothetical protein